jgi:hypothetical protein
MKKHLLVTVDQFEALVKFSFKNNPTLSEIEKNYLKEEVKRCRKLGYKYMPFCNNFDKKTGECLGHE